MIERKRIQELIAEVDTEEAAAAAIEPIGQGDQQWAARGGDDWKPSPGIEAMNAMYPTSQPLTREQPPPPRVKVTMEQAQDIKRQRYGRAFWLMPWQRSEFHEIYEIIDAPRQTLPIPEYVGHHDDIIAGRKAAAALITKREPLKHRPEPKQSRTFFT